MGAISKIYSNRSHKMGVWSFERAGWGRGGGHALRHAAQEWVAAAEIAQERDPFPVPFIQPN